MRALVRDGMTKLIVTHEMRFAEDIADRLVVMDQGRIVDQGHPASCSARRRIARCYIEVVRGMPSLTLLFLIYFGLSFRRHRAARLSGRHTRPWHSRRGISGGDISRRHSGDTSWSAGGRADDRHARATGAAPCRAATGVARGAAAHG